MNEMLLHYFWKNKIFSQLDLRTTDRRPISLVHTGFPHQDAGPDFKQAVMKIDDITWVGDVEIHIRTSDWLKHGHQRDPKYQSIILHVVYQNDMDIGMACPTLELKQYISDELIAEYEKLSRSPDLLPCRKALPEVSPLQFTSWLTRLAVGRFERRQEEVFGTLHQCREDWHETVFRSFVVNFGFRANKAAFELLAKNLPYKSVLKHKDSRLQVYALVFGQAGMLEDESDEAKEDGYFTSLQAEYQYLQYKYQLAPIPPKVWNMLRLRPQNFPCVRLAQLSECLYRIPDIIEQILHSKDVAELENIVNFEPQPYWSTHRQFGRASPAHSCRLGRQAVDLLIVNSVVPLRLAYATFSGDDVGKQAALGMAESREPERNCIIRQYAEAGFPVRNALDSQAILELHRYYCTPKRCLQCDIGCLILKKW